MFRVQTIINIDLATGGTQKARYHTGTTRCGGKKNAKGSAAVVITSKHIAHEEKLKK